MWRLLIAILVVPAAAFADTFSFTLGSPVASQDFRSKTAAFVFRAEGCGDTANAKIDGTAEGLVDGARTSVTLKVAETARPGVYAVYQTWGPNGDWVVNLKGTCDGATAGAVVPMGPSGFIRESARFFTRPASAAEINSALQALSQGRHK